MSIIITNELPPIEAPKLTLPGDHRKDCCKQTENLEYWYANIPAGSTCLRCKKCGCRHFELDANPGRIGIRG